MCVRKHGLLRQFISRLTRTLSVGPSRARGDMSFFAAAAADGENPRLTRSGQGLLQSAISLWPCQVTKCHAEHAGSGRRITVRMCILDVHMHLYMQKPAEYRRHTYAFQPDERTLCGIGEGGKTSVPVSASSRRRRLR